MMGFRVFDLILLPNVDDCMLVRKLSRLRRLDDAQANEHVSLPVAVLYPIEVELGLERMVNLGLLREQIVHNLDYWVVVVVRGWIEVAGELSGNEYFLALFQLKNELLLDECFLLQDCLDVENIVKTAHSHYKSDFNELLVKHPGVELEPELGSGISAWVQRPVANLHVLKKICAISPLEQTEASLQLVHVMLLMVRTVIQFALRSSMFVAMTMAMWLCPVGRVLSRRDSLLQENRYILLQERLQTRFESGVRQLLNGSQAKEFELLRLVELELALAHFRVSVVGDEPLDAGADIAIEYGLELPHAGSGIVAHGRDAAAGGECLVR